MPSFGSISDANLSSCDERLQRLFREVVKHFDCSVLEGYRSNARQAQLLIEKRTTVGPGKSTHNHLPSRGVDVVPYPIDWNDRERFYLFAGFVKGVASQMGIKVRYGGDWDSDYDLKDQTFNDLPHWEVEQE